jgi:hypothetical protein
MAAVNPPTQSQSLLDGATKRVLLEIVRQLRVLRNMNLLGTATVTAPAPSEAANLRVKRGRVDCYAPERHACRYKPAAERIDEPRWPAHLARRIVAQGLNATFAENPAHKLMRRFAVQPIN